MSKILLVTGASRGIGAATAKLAASRGYDVAVNYLRDAKAADAVVAAIKTAGRRAVAIQGDMAKEADVARVFETIDKELGRITHLVYNSGTTGANSRVEAADVAMMREVIELNVLGALMCVKAAIPRMSVKQGGQGGAIVLICQPCLSEFGLKLDSVVPGVQVAGSGYLENFVFADNVRTLTW